MRGSITKRGKRSWRIVYDEPTQDGRRKQRTVTVHGLKREAEEKLAEIMASMGKAEYVEPSKQTLGAYLSSWVSTKRAAPSTLSGYRMIINSHLIPSLGHIPLQVLGYQHIEKYYEDKRQDVHSANGDLESKALSEQTLKHHHALLRKALRDATKRKLVPRCIMDDVEAPSPKQPEITVIDSELNKELISIFEDQYRSMVVLSLLTGMRRGEVCGLKWDKVNDNHILVHRSLSYVDGKLELKRPKSEKSYRKVSIGKKLVAELRSQRARQAKEKLAAGDLYHDQSFVFADPLGEPVLPPTFTQWFGRSVEGTRFSSLNLHALRHSCATQLIHHGTNIKTVSERLGHSSIVFTLDRYGHLLPAVDEEAADFMDSTF